MKLGHIHAMIMVACLLFVANSKLLHRQVSAQDPTLALDYADSLNFTQRTLQ